MNINLMDISGKLKKSAPSRIVNVSSIMAKVMSNLNPNDLNKHPKGQFIENILYANTKLCNILFTIELAKKLEGTEVIVNTLHPGTIKTEIFRTSSGLNRIVATVLRILFFKTAEEGAQTSIYVALSKDIEGISGELFENCRQVAMYDSAKHASLAKETWKKSEEFVKLKEGEQL